MSLQNQGFGSIPKSDVEARMVSTGLSGNMHHHCSWNVARLRAWGRMPVTGLLQALHFHRALRRLACEHKEARMASADFSTVEICGVLVC